MVKALRTSVRGGGLRQGGLQPGIGSDNIFATASLDLDFARHKNLGQQADATTGSNLIDFTRASSATYVGSDGLIKTATTNLLLRSEEFDNGWSTFGLSVTANQETAPNGLLAADLISIAGSGQGIWQFITCTPGLQYTVSAYVKLGTLSAANYKIAVRNDTAGVFIASGITPTQTPSSTGWTRISYTVTAPAGCTTLRFYPFRNTTNVTGTIYLWGAQLEASSTVGEYVKTTSTINSAPRFDHDPTTGESLGLLVEESRANLAIRSSELNNTSVWGRTGVSFDANAATAPDGSTDADKMIAGTAPSEQRIRDDIGSLSSSTSYTLSIFAKAAGYDYLVINHGDYLVADYNTWFDLATGTVETNPAGSTARIEDVGNGWYRCSVTRTTTATQNTISARFLVSNADNVISFTGDGTSGIYIWGAQLEEGSFPTSYIPTTDSTVTRAADVASITGSNFSSWYRQDEGSAFVDFTMNGVNTGNNFIYDFSNGTINEEIFLNYQDTGNARWAARVANVQVTQDQSGAGLPRVKHAFGMASNNYMVARDGILSTGSSQVGMPSNTLLRLGARFNDTAASNGTIRRLTYWPTRLGDGTLQTITQ